MRFETSVYHSETCRKGFILPQCFVFIFMKCSDFVQAGIVKKDLIKIHGF